jgi:hypothetical protein
MKRTSSGEPIRYRDTVSEGRSRRPMTRRRRHGVRSGAVVLLLASACGATACTPPPPGDAWVLEPLRYDNRLEGEPVPQLIDMTYPMGLVGDTDGGVWGESSSSWLHLAADGDALQRFNLPGAPAVALGAAISPTRVIVVETVTGAPSYSSIQEFDTRRKIRTEILRDPRPVADVTVADGSLYVVAHALDREAFTIERTLLIDPGPLVPFAEAIAGYGPAAIAATPDGRILLATSEERIVFDRAGAVESRTAVTSGRPFVAVNDRGDIAWSTDAPVDADVRHVVVGGSREARQVLAAQAPCGRGRLEVVRERTAAVLPFLCAPTGIAGTGDGFVVSVGSESGAVLARLLLPRGG